MATGSFADAFIHQIYHDDEFRGGIGQCDCLDGAGVCLDKAHGEASVPDLPAIHLWWIVLGYYIPSHESYVM